MMKLTAIGALLAIGLVLAFGLYVFGLGVRNVARGMASSHWPKTMGKVVRSETHERHEAATRRTVSSVIYSADTVIQYTVDGKQYSTNVIHFGQTLGSGDASEAELQHVRYPVDAQVQVSYDPSHPWIAAARPGLHAEAFWLPGAGLAFLLPGALALLVCISLFRTLPQQLKGEDDFQKQVESAIESGRRGIAPPDMPFRPPKDASDMIVPIAAGGFAAVFCGLGILALSAGAQRMWRGSASQHWPSVEGSVTFSRVGSSETRDEDNQRATTFSPQFVYTYEVDGSKHFNNLRRFGQVEGSGENWAADIAEHYPLGKKVQVYYYPADPDVAVLETGNNSEGLWLPGVGLVALLFGTATLIWIVPATAR